MQNAAPDKQEPNTGAREKGGGAPKKDKKKKYLVAVFESGEGDLYQSTLELLSYNKQRCAEIEVNREKQRTAINTG